MGAEQNIGHVNRLREIGAGIIGRAVTDTLYVSPNGSGLDGTTWAMAFKTLQEALAAASVDGDDCTLINVSPHATQYDIDTAGDPTWAGNYIIIGSHRLWAPIVNNHASATSIMNFSGKVSIRDLAIFQTAAVNGVKFTGSGFRIRHCGFNSTALTGPATAICIDGTAATTRGGIIEDIQVLGHVGRTKALHINGSEVNEFGHMHIHRCLTGVHIEDADSSYNVFHNIDIGDCALGVDIDAGSEQHFEHIDFHHNTINVDDEVGDSTWADIHGDLAVSLLPDNFTGVGLVGGAANTWGNNTEILSAASRTRPFRVNGVSMEASANEKFRVRLSADGGVTHFLDIQIEGALNAAQSEAISLPSGTERIFNYNTQISGSSKSESGGDTATVWLALQEI